MLVRYKNVMYNNAGSLMLTQTTHKETIPLISFLDLFADFSEIQRAQFNLKMCFGEVKTVQKL